MLKEPASPVVQQEIPRHAPHRIKQRSIRAEPAPTEKSAKSTQFSDVLVLPDKTASHRFINRPKLRFKTLDLLP